MNRIAFCACLGAVALSGLTEAGTKTGAKQGKTDKDAAWADVNEPVQAAEDDWRVYWKDGVRIESAEQGVAIEIGGRIMYDLGFLRGHRYENDGGPDLTDYAEFRRARFYISGSVDEYTKFKAQYDFAGGDVAFKDMWIQRTDLLNFKIGHFKEPFGLEALGSSKNITFIERASPTIAFSPFRNAGAMIGNTFNQASGTWALGIFQKTDSTGDDDDIEGGWVITGRTTYLPRYADEGKALVHLGLAATHRDADPDFQYRARPEAHGVDFSVDTGAFDSDHATTVGAEAAWVHGPFSLQGELTKTFVDSSFGDDPNFMGYYAQASYFLTGEHRPYNRSNGAFDRVRPNSDFGGGGSGAVQLAARYSNIDLDDSDIDGNEQENITVGANWYLNKNTRFMVNYVHTHLDSPVGEDADFLLFRFQIDF